MPSRDWSPLPPPHPPLSTPSHPRHPGKCQRWSLHCAWYHNMTRLSTSKSQPICHSTSTTTMNKTCKAATISPWNLIISMLAITVQFSLYNTFSAWVKSTLIMVIVKVTLRSRWSSDDSSSYGDDKVTSVIFQSLSMVSSVIFQSSRVIFQSYIPVKFQISRVSSSLSYMIRSPLLYSRAFQWSAPSFCPLHLSGAVPPPPSAFHPGCGSSYLIISYYI